MYLRQSVSCVLLLLCAGAASLCIASEYREDRHSIERSMIDSEDPNQLSSDTDADAKWQAYKRAHGKSYSVPVEDLMHRRIYEARVKRIEKHNDRYKRGLVGFWQAINRFTDLSDDEIRVNFKGLRPLSSESDDSDEFFEREGDEDDDDESDEVDTSSLPQTVDWRHKGYVTAVKDQHRCGSCWAFSATGALEGQNFARTGRLVSLSEQNLVDCSRPQGNHGCSGGWPYLAFNYVKQNGGIDKETFYPYIGRDDNCHYSADGRGAQSHGYVRIAQGSEAALQAAVARVGPISVAIDASHASFHSYGGGVYDEPRCCACSIDHAVLVVGYGTTATGKDYWLVKNSWNTTWGEHGYIRMSRNKNNQCEIASYAFYPLV